MALRPAAPARGRGRIQVAARRAFIVLGDVVTTRQVAEWAFVRKLLLLGLPLGNYDRRRVRRALRQIAEPIGRAGGMGRPLMWRLLKSRQFILAYLN